MAGVAQGLPALADRPLVVGPLPSGGHLGARDPSADPGGPPRRRSGRGAEDRLGRYAERALRAPKRGRGFDGGKRLNGRKRHVVMRSAGFLPVALVTAASLHDKHGVDPLLGRAHAAGWRLRRLIGDGSYAGDDVAGDAARHGATFSVALRPRQRKGFTPIPLRWRVEQGLGILTTRDRRLGRDWEQLPEVAETMMFVANLRRLIRVLARSH